MAHTRHARIGTNAILVQGVEAFFTKREEVIGVQVLHVLCHLIDPCLQR